MELIEKKRVRSSNWEENEKRLLRQIVIQKIDVIENKQTTTNTNTLKKAAWQEVLVSFNSLNKTKRDLSQLMTQWRNMKGLVKSRESEYRRARLLTGGGPPPPSPPAEDLALIEAIPNEFVVDINYFDSDGLYQKTLKQSQTLENPKLVSDCEEPLTPVPSSSKQHEVTRLVSDCEEPLTPVMSSSKQYEESTRISESKDLLTNQNKVILTTTPVSAQNPKRRKLNISKNKTMNQGEDYEKELFLLMKKNKEREYQRAEEIYKEKLAILSLEKEYWIKKLNQD